MADRRRCQPDVYLEYASSTRTSARKIHYYRCLGSDAWRYGGKAKCDCRPVRQDLLDHIVWSEIVRLLEDPTLIQTELDRRLAAARNANPSRQHEQTLSRELAQVRKRMERLLTAYQEDLLSLDELRRRLPELRQRENGLQAEIEALNAQVADQAAYLRLAQTLSTFLTRLRASADTLDIAKRQQIVRLLVKEVIVGRDSITIRHSIPHLESATSSGNNGLVPTRHTEKMTAGTDSLLRPWRTVAPAGQRAAR